MGLLRILSKAVTAAALTEEKSQYTCFEHCNGAINDFDIGENPR